MEPLTESASAPALSTSSNGGPASPKSRGAAWFGIVTAAVLLVGLPLAVAGRVIWGEWQALREEERRAANSAVVGYPNIFPVISTARKPDPWFRVEGDSVFIWCGWKNGQGHRWFRARQGDFERQAIGDPIGRDVSRAIDYPVIENGGGPIWERIPGGADVIGLTIGDCVCAYPLAVLGKVLIINDEMEGRPYLIHFEPFRAGTPVSIFDPRVDGHRITLGSSGFSFQGRHVLYDRGTESLWADDGEGLTAFAGRYKGKRLPLVARLGSVAWSDWRSRHPQSRLVVGSLDRGNALPPE